MVCEYMKYALAEILNYNNLLLHTKRLAAIKKIVSENREQMEIFLTVDGDIRWNKYFEKLFNIICQSCISYDPVILSPEGHSCVQQGISNISIVLFLLVSKLKTPKCLSTTECIKKFIQKY